MIEPVKIKPAIQHYAWGGLHYIPALLGIDNKEQKPFAEAWYGDHPLAPATVQPGLSDIPLNQWIAQYPEDILGKESIAIYGAKMPFLLKILDVKDMLSLQLHPTKEAAVEGYAVENEKGIPLSAAHRNYKDPNHKPELLFALSDFRMLQGFAPLPLIIERFHILLPEFSFEENYMDWRSIMNRIWGLAEDVYVQYITSIGSRIKAQDYSNKNKIFYWIQKALITYPFKPGSVDRGILIMMMMHVQYLRPGQVGYQAPGVLHAYLEGQNVELMANSDNVLRGGLTPKHIDPTELMEHLDTTQSGQCLIEPMYLMDDEIAFTVPVPDFMLKVFRLKRGTRKEIQFTFASILIVQSGEISLNGIIAFGGKSIFIPAFTPTVLESDSEESVSFLAIG